MVTSSVLIILVLLIFKIPYTNYKIIRREQIY
ncbi:hypothetical protein [Parvimonas micra]